MSDRKRRIYPNGTRLLVRPCPSAPNPSVGSAIVAEILEIGIYCRGASFSYHNQVLVYIHAAEEVIGTDGTRLLLVDESDVLATLADDEVTDAE